MTDFIALPKKPVPLINGETYYLYIDNMLNKPIDKYCHKYIYNSGIPTVNRKRLSVLTPNSLGLKNIGMAINDQMSLYIAGYNKFFQAEVIDGTLLNNKSAKILTVGDSFTDIGGWMAYEKAKLESFGASIEFIGNTNSHDPNRKCEGWGGAKAEKYAIKWGAAYEIEVASTVSVQTHARYTVVVDPSNNTTRIMTVLGVATFSNKKVLRISQDVRGSDPWTTIPSSGTITKESGSGDASISYTNLAVCDWNPFWDVAQNKLSFTTYCNKWNVNPDILFLQFMHNDVKETTSPIGDNTFETGITTDAQFNAALDKLEALISTWYTEMGSSKKIVVALQSLTIVDGGPSLIPQYWKYIEKFYERYQNDNRIIVMPVYPFVDNINGYPTREITPCPYYPNDKEIEATDGHPYTAWEQYGHCTAAGVAKAILEMV